MSLPGVLWFLSSWPFLLMVVAELVLSASEVSIVVAACLIIGANVGTSETPLAFAHDSWWIS